MVTHEIKGKLEGEPRSPKSWSKGLFILRENILVVDPIISGRQHELRASKTFTPFGRVSSALGRTQRRNVLREQDGLTWHPRSHRDSHRGRGKAPFLDRRARHTFYVRTAATVVQGACSQPRNRDRWGQDKPVSNAAEGAERAQEAFNRRGTCPPTSEGQASPTHGRPKNPGRTMARGAHR